MYQREHAPAHVFLSADPIPNPWLDQVTDALAQPAPIFLRDALCDARANVTASALYWSLSYLISGPTIDSSPGWASPTGGCFSYIVMLPSLQPIAPCVE